MDERVDGGVLRPGGSRDRGDGRVVDRAHLERAWGAVRPGSPPHAQPADSQCPQRAERHHVRKHVRQLARLLQNTEHGAAHGGAAVHERAPVRVGEPADGQGGGPEPPALPLLLQVAGPPRLQAGRAEGGRQVLLESLRPAVSALAHRGQAAGGRGGRHAHAVGLHSVVRSRLPGSRPDLGVRRHYQKGLEGHGLRHSRQG